MMEERLCEAVEARARDSVAPLFDGWQETMLWSALEGEMGHVWTLENGVAFRAALCECADFLFLAGELSAAERLLCAWRRERAGQYIIAAAREEALNALIPKLFGGDAKQTTRCAFRKDTCLDTERLKQLAGQAPKGVSLRLFDREIYALAMSAPWSKDLCSQFLDAQDFLARGIGVAALANGELVGGASSYTRYRRGIEIQVETRMDMRCRGIATACAAKLILQCLSRGLYPSWDAANEASVRLAEKLGYQAAERYIAWDLYGQNA